MGGAEGEGEIMCAWHICDRVDPAACRKRAQLYCVGCSSSRCRDCHAADAAWAVAWRDPQLCQPPAMRLDVRERLCADVGGRDELWVGGRDCQEQPRVLRAAELALWKAVTGQAEVDEGSDNGGVEAGQAMERRVGVDVEGAEEGEQAGVEGEEELASDDVDIMS